MIGRESLPQGAVDDELLLEAETLAGAAMRRRSAWSADEPRTNKKGRIAPPLFVIDDAR